MFARRFEPSRAGFVQSGRARVTPGTVPAAWPPSLLDHWSNTFAICSGAVSRAPFPCFISVKPAGNALSCGAASAGRGQRAINLVHAAWWLRVFPGSGADGQLRSNRQVR